MTGKEETVMPKGSEKLTNARKEEIVNACASLYETMGFKDITIRDIGEKTSFTRTSIYNYFQTKEEIFLALLQREHEAWIADLETIIHQHESLSAGEFAHELAVTLERRGTMLKLMSMNLYDMEGNSRLENLVSFKRCMQKPCGPSPAVWRNSSRIWVSTIYRNFFMRSSHSCLASIRTPRPRTNKKRPWRLPG